MASVIACVVRKALLSSEQVPLWDCKLSPHGAVKTAMPRVGPARKNGSKQSPAAMYRLLAADGRAFSSALAAKWTTLASSRIKESMKSDTVVQKYCERTACARQDAMFGTLPVRLKACDTMELISAAKTKTQKTLFVISFD